MEEQNKKPAPSLEQSMKYIAWDIKQIAQYLKKLVEIMEAKKTDAPF